MKNNKQTSTINLLKFLSLFAAVSTALACWMFSVASTVTLLNGSLVNAGPEQIDGMNIATNIANDLGVISITFSVLTLFLSFIYLSQSKKKEKNYAGYKAPIVAILLIILVLFKENILTRLITSS